MSRNCYNKIWSSSPSLLAKKDHCNQIHFEEIDVCVLVNTATVDQIRMSDTQDRFNKIAIPKNKVRLENTAICKFEAIPEVSDMENSTFTEKSMITENDSDRCASEIIEEHKQLLIKAVAQRLNQKKPEDKIWEEIENKTGYDHRTAWKDMRNIAINKLEYLLPANDLLANIPTNMHLTATEWLLFDLVLVHEKLNVVNIAGPSNTGTGSKHEPECLQDLFKLVKDLRIEELVGDVLKEAWKRLTLTYNARGRHCSPMMLQLRWYQLKQLTRDCFYSQPPSLTSSCHIYKPTPLQTSIAVTFTNIIMQQLYPTWETLIEKKCVILFEEFETTSSFCQSEMKPNLTESSNMPPVIEINDDMEEDVAQVSCLSDLSKSIEGYTNALRYALSKSKETDTKSTQEALPKSVETTNGTSQDTNKKSIQVKTNSLKHLLSTSIEESTEALHDAMPETVETIVVDNEEEEFKHRLVKDVIRMIQEKTPMRIIWPTLSKKSGRDCKKYWTQMRANTLAKVDALQAANDSADQAAAEMRLSAADWLFFDLVLVHEKVDLCSRDRPRFHCLYDLYRLVQKHNVENLARKDLAEAWIDITLQYNSKGRECSPMLLQRRWQQLKQLSRDHVFKDSSSLLFKTRRLLLAIATKFQKIVTQELHTWKDLMTQKYVVLPEEFVKTIKRISKWKELNAHEGWYLHKKEEISNSPSNSESMSNAKQIEVIELDEDDEINEILREKADQCKNMVQNQFNNKSSNKLQMASKHIIEILCCSDDETDTISPEKVNTIHNQNITASNETKKRKNDEDEEDEVHFDSNIVFVDDGIEFEEGNEHNTKDVESTTASTSDPEIDVKLLMNTAVYTKRIDYMEVFRFLNYDSVNDKRVIDFVESESKPVNKRALRDKEIMSLKKYMTLGNKEDNVNSDVGIVESTVENHLNKVKYTSSLLQKPKRRRYLSSQLSKNPDFNVELKTFTHDFFNSTRNRVLLKDCKPVTIDVHKSFENKLINGTMYLKRSEFKRATERQNKTVTILSSSTPERVPEKQINPILPVRSEKESLQIVETSTRMPVKRNKVINLPDKEQIRLINQSLLTAEITPEHQPLFNRKIEFGAEPIRKPKQLPINIPNTDAELSKQSSLCDVQESKDFKTANHTCIENDSVCIQINPHTSLASKRIRNEASLSIPSRSDANNSDKEVKKKVVFTIKHKTIDGVAVKESKAAYQFPQHQNLINHTNRLVLNNTKTINRLLLKNNKNVRARLLISKTNQQKVRHCNDSINVTPSKAIYYTVNKKLHSTKDATCTVTKPVNSQKSYQEVASATKKYAQIKDIIPLRNDNSQFLLSPPTRQDESSPAYVAVPNGVNFVTLPGEGLAVSINPGVQVDTDQLYSLMSVCHVVNSKNQNQPAVLNYVNFPGPSDKC